MSELNLILLGPPGAGKGTQAARLRADFGLLYIATGEMLRAAIREDTELGRQAKQYLEAGKLVPDQIIIGVILKMIDGEEAGDGFLLDGFPRNLAQAEALDRALERLGRRLTAALLIDAPDDDVVRRISGRRVCTKNEHIYHVEFDPPKHDMVCDHDGSPLIQRDDDREETVRHRLAVYHDETAPVIDYYEHRRLLHRFDGRRSPTEVHDHIRATLATLRLEEQL